MQINEALLVFTLPVEGGLWNFCVCQPGIEVTTVFIPVTHMDINRWVLNSSTAAFDSNTPLNVKPLLGMVFLFLTLHENNIICKVGNICSLK